MKKFITLYAIVLCKQAAFEATQGRYKNSLIF